MDSKGKIILIALCLMIVMQGAFAASCIVMSTGGVSDMDLEYNTNNYVSLRVYNSNPDDSVICDSGEYHVSIELIEPHNDLDTFFDTSFDVINFNLENGQNQQVLLTINPDVDSGDYKFRVTATKSPTGTVGTGSVMVVTTSADITATVTNNGSNTDKPLWVDRVECADGSTVNSGETCAAGVAGIINDLTIFTALLILIVVVGLIIWYKRK